MIAISRSYYCVTVLSPSEEHPINPCAQTIQSCIVGSNKVVWSCCDFPFCAVAMELPQLTFRFEDSPQRDTLVLPLGRDVGADALGSLKLQFHSQIAKARDYIAFFAVLENDNGIYLLYVPEKQYAHLPNAKSALKTILKNIGVDTNMACALKFMDLNTLIEFGIFQSDKKKEREEFTKKKDKDLPLTFENADFEAEEPDPDCEWENYYRQVQLGVEEVGGRLFLKALKYTPVTEHVDPIGWRRAGPDWTLHEGYDNDWKPRYVGNTALDGSARPDAKPCDWTTEVEQGCDLESRMRALALEDEPAGPKRKVSIPPSKGRRIHEDPETQTVEGSRVHVLDIAQHTTFDGVLFIPKAKASKTRGEQEWVETLTNALEEKGVLPILEDIYDTAIELMDQGALPEVERDPNADTKKSLAVQRCRKARDLLDKTISTHAWKAMTDAEFKRACRNIAQKHGTKESAKGHTCTHCTKPAHACTHYLVTSEAWIWKPISELADEKVKDVKIFCSRKCEEKWQEVLICPDCNTCDYTKTTGVQSYPSPKALMDMTTQYQSRLLQADMIPKEKVKNTDESRLYWAEFQRQILRGETPSAGREVVPEKPIKMWTREPRRVNVAICVTCSSTMLPRNPLAAHLCSSIAQLCC